MCVLLTLSFQDSDISLDGLQIPFQRSDFCIQGPNVRRLHFTSGDYFSSFHVHLALVCVFVKSQDATLVITISILSAAVEANLVVVARAIRLVAIDAHDTFRWGAGGTIGEVIGKTVPGHACVGLLALYTKRGAHSTVGEKRAPSGEEVLLVLLRKCKKALPVTSATGLISIKPRCPACGGGWWQCGLARGRLSTARIPCTITRGGITLGLILQARMGTVKTVSMPLLCEFAAALGGRSRCWCGGESGRGGNAITGGLERSQNAGSGEPVLCDFFSRQL